MSQQGYLTQADIIDEFPDEHTSPGALQGMPAALAQMGIVVLEDDAKMQPDADRAPMAVIDRDALDEGSALLEDMVRGASASTDPLAVHARRMHEVPLLTPDDEVTLVREIEAARHAILWALASCPEAVEALIVHLHVSADEDARAGNCTDIRQSLASMRGALRSKGDESRTDSNARMRMMEALGEHSCQPMRSSKRAR
ncbi:RNA polymerase primary sigma factor [Paraburkholderia diazotrophica]|uniref:RNA polymerase primary sigma factor n=1 Tax=Paraburkholderia diazotrophica TaxID=667676 RepID=A0A1H7EAK0_9BURK|nr:RNA polymerase sigma factor region1.1 domain-containing protein [Paraburkholderia diazotrophica]SEK10931.1 RNA polymerase primary sigma factor [Paraburkholderia diazotrophica]